MKNLDLKLLINRIVLSTRLEKRQNCAIANRILKIKMQTGDTANRLIKSNLKIGKIAEA